ncbi:MAG: STAS domain-containing protein [Limimaricola sp.]|uniref:SulP family inorganic anion transporter n=1 Tax=Limimaricola sp. TaxID=2211665 RepID=UPI001D855415|nr:SulP family inorganic anion transporter [Limimaricola sp.]MBI1415914.1 STAS domain-containing protein [Limimaricola sp.]
MGTSSSGGGLFPTLRSYRATWLPGDAAAALTLAAIAIPEQLATARLIGLPPVTGLLAFAAGTLAFAVFGRARALSVGADSTIAPVIGGTLAVLALAGGGQVAGLAVVLALMVGLLLLGAWVMRLGWAADLMSQPVTTGFLIGIAVHIVIGQLPVLLGLPTPPGTGAARLWDVMATLQGTHALPLAVGGGMLAIALAAEWLNPRLPGPLLGLAASLGLVLALGRGTGGLEVLGDVTLQLQVPHLTLPGWPTIAALLPLALVVAVLVMIQTAAVLQALDDGALPESEDAIGRTFAALGAANIAAAALGAFPVNASPPRSAIVANSGGRSQLAGVLAVAVCAVVVLAGGGLLALVPQAALAGTLIFIATRIVRARLALRIARQSPQEALLLVASAALVVFLPIGVGVGLAIVLSLVHSLYTIARPQCRELLRLPGTTIWWADTPERPGQREDGVLVMALGAPVNFINTRGMLAQIDTALATRPARLLVIEAAAVASIDFTGADLLRDRVAGWRAGGFAVALARLESQTATGAARRTGLIAAFGPGAVHHSVEDAVRAWKAGALA